MEKGNERNIKNEKRSKNFKDSEVDLLLDLVDNSKNTLENKRTDQVTLKEKEICWMEIKNNFNLISGIYFRDWKTLKNKYDNIKKTSRKKWTEEKKYVLGTGGGPSKPTMLNKTDIKVKEILGDLPLFGMTSKFDSDAVVDDDVTDTHEVSYTTTEFDLSDANVIVEEGVTDNLFDHCYAQQLLSGAIGGQEDTREQTEPKLTSSGHFLVQKSPQKIPPTTEEVKVQQLPQPPQFDTQFSVKKLQSKTSSPLKLKKKRASPLDNTLAGRRIEVLAQTKSDLCELQKELVKRQIQHEEEEHKKKMELLKLKIKNEELKLKQNQGC